MRELYRQPIKTGNGEHVTMLGMVSDLTGVVRGYYGQYKRPLGERRKELQQAHRVGNRIVRIAAERAWRQMALQDVLHALKIQDGKMHQLVNGILTEATASHHLSQHADLHGQLQTAFDRDDIREIREVSSQLYRISHQTLDFFDIDSSHRTIFSSKLERVRKNDPAMQRRILFTLDEVATLRRESIGNKVPKQREIPVEIEVFSNR